MPINTVNVLVPVAGLVLLWRWLGKRNPDLPPGPQGYPLLGNALEMPTVNPFYKFTEWGRKYGGIMSVTALGQVVIVINSFEVLEEFHKKGTLYSNRPLLPMGGLLLGFDQTVVLAPYGDRWRAARKLFTSAFGPGKAIQSLHPIVLDEVREFVKRLSENPHELYKHCNMLAKGTILHTTYGHRVQEFGDPYLELIYKANGNFDAVTKPGAYLVNIFPSLLKLPDWFPGTGFKKVGREGRKDTEAMANIPYENCVKGIEQGTTPACFVSNTLEQFGDKLTPQDAWDVKWAATAMYAAGTDSTTAASYAFFLAMALHPEVQKKAQTEIDAIVGSGRLPTFEDREHLPYVNAVVTELLRWSCPGPIGAPHQATEDSWSAGYFIPKEAVIITNLWGMLYDPARYPNPQVFDPERHLDVPGRERQFDPRRIIFGFSRRVCPGSPMADAFLYAMVVTTLAVLEISKKIGEDAKPITPEYKYTTRSGTLFPEEFECTVRRRSDAHVALLP